MVINNKRTQTDKVLMQDVREGDWKVRIKAYENILQMMANPSEELLDQLYTELPKYLSDDNVSCLRTALLICEKYFKAAQDIDYVAIASVLIDNCLNQKQQIVDSAINIISLCLKEEREAVTAKLFDGLIEKPPQIILAVISIIVAHLANLTSKDAEEATNIIEEMKPLTKYEDKKIAKEAKAAIAAAKFVCGTDMDTLGTSIGTDPSPEAEAKKAAKQEEQRWAQLLTSSNWKDRKIGYEELLESIDESSQLQSIEHHFLIPAGTEKNVVCEGIVVQIIVQLSEIFKTQLARKLREYITPIINMLMQKRQSKLQVLQSAFDTVAQNVVSSPYEPPFCEHLLKMMQGQSVRLKEEAVAFIMRWPVKTLSAPISSALQALTSDPAATVRELASNAFKQIYGTEEAPQKEVVIAEPEKPKQKRAGSPEVIRSAKRRSMQSSKAAWENWVDPETLKLLNSGQWVSVTNGLEALQRQFEEDPSHPSVVVMGLASLFTGKTFTPKVMQNLMQNLLHYLRYAPDKTTDEALSATITFALDKIQDKRFEQPIFEILDTCAECQSTQFVFQAMYPYLGVKNPILPLRVVSYFAYHLKQYGKDASLNMEEFANQLKPAFSHSDSAIRKMANECLQVVSGFDSAAANEYFSYVKGKSEPKKQAEPKHEEFKPMKTKGRSEIPVPGRNRPVSPSSKHPPQKQKPEEKCLFPSRLVQSIAKMQSILDTRRALDEAELILTKQIEQFGPSSVPSSEFTELFVRLRQWFKESNTNIVLSVTNLLTLCFKAIMKDQISNVSSEFLCDVCLLLNFAHKGIRNAALTALTQLDAIHSNFVPDILLPMFGKLNVDGKKAGVNFMKGLKFEMNIEQYTPLITYFLADKSESFREQARPLIEKFLQLPGASDSLRATADQYPPAQKSQILTRLQAIEQAVEKPEPEKESSEAVESPFKVLPTKSEAKIRQENLDPFLPLKVLNCEEQPTTLGAVLQGYSDKYFNHSITGIDEESIRASCIMLLEIGESDFDHFSLILDIILMWWSNQALLVKQQEGFNEIIQFLSTVLDELKTRKRKLSQFEFTIILPTILECYGRDEAQWDGILKSILSISNMMDVLEMLTKLLTMASSVYTLVATFKALMKFVIPVCDATNYIPSLTKSATKIHNLVASQKDQEELFEITTKFLEVISAYGNEDKKVDEPKEDERKQSPRRLERKISPAKIEKPSVPKPQSLVSPRRIEPKQASPPKPLESIPVSQPRQSPDHPPRRMVAPVEDILEKVNDPSVQIYRWIADVWSSEHRVMIQALKSLSTEMKENPSLFMKHTDALVVALISKIHTQFAADPIPIRVCKYLAFCLLNLFNETDLTNGIKREYIQQIIYELLTHLTNGISEPVLNQVLNAIIIKLLEDCPMYSFMGLLAAVGEWNNYDQISEKWLRMSLKCLEPCGVRICEIGNVGDVKTAVQLVKEFLKKNPKEQIEASPIGGKIMTVLNNFLRLAAESFQIT